MTKKLIFDAGKIKLTAVLLILAFTLSGCFGFLTVDEEMQEAIKKGDASLCDDLDISEKKNRRDKCYQKVAEKTKNPAVCAKIKDKFYWDMCYGEVAELKLDSGLCKEIKKPRNKDKCYSTVAIGKNNSSICDNIKDKHIKGGCLKHIAVAKGNAKLCDDIEDQSLKTACLMQVAVEIGDVAPCNYVGSPEQSECYKLVAIKTQDIELCDEIYLEKSNIKNECIIQIAIALNNPTLCERIKDDENKDNCKKWISEDTGSDMSLCSEITDKKKKESCIKNIATQYNKPELCKDLEIYKDICLKDVAFRNSQSSICNELDDTQKIYDCHFKIARDKKDASYCLTITKAGTKEKCIHNMAVTYKDVKVCANIQDVVLKNKCEDSVKLNKIQE